MSLRIRTGLEVAVFAISVAGLGALAIFLWIFPNALWSNVAPIVGLLPLVLLVPGFRNLIEYQTEISHARGQSGLRTLNLALMTGAKALLVWQLLSHFGESRDWLLGLSMWFSRAFISCRWSSPIQAFAGPQKGYESEASRRLPAAPVWRPARLPASVFPTGCGGAELSRKPRTI